MSQTRPPIVFVGYSHDTPEHVARVLALAGHADYVSGVAVTPDGRRLVSASGDRKLKVWDLATGQETATLTGHEDWISAMTVTPDGRRAVSATDDHTLKVWDLQTGQELATIHSRALSGVSPSLLVEPRSWPEMP